MHKNLETVKNYFANCVDGKAVDRVGEYFADDVIVHRPDVAEPIVGVEKFKHALRSNVTDRYETIKTTFSKEVVTEDVVVVALTHRATGSNVWHGFDVAGKPVTWTALTYFRFNPEGKVVEEIVERNELFMAKQLGIIDYARCFDSRKLRHGKIEAALVSNSALASGLLDSSRSGAVGKGAAGVRLSGHAASPSSSSSQVGMTRPSSSNWLTPQLFAPRTAGVGRQPDIAYRGRGR
jgi:ketosteroid isomerase-like protein